MGEPTIRIGQTYGPYRRRIDEDAPAAYALATNDPNDIYLRDRIVPPVYTVALIHSAHSASLGSVEPGAIAGARVSVHAEHDIRLWAPVVPGTNVNVKAVTQSARQTSAGTVVTQQILVTDEQDNVLVEHLWSSIHVGGRIERDLGAPPADHAFPASARAGRIGVHTVDVTRDQTFRYAGASSDNVAHSLDDQAARAEGFPGKILQGLCTFAMCSGAVVRIAGHGDPRRLRRLAGRFSSPVFPPCQLVVEIFAAGRADDGGNVVAFEASANGVTVLQHGRAELRPDDSMPGAGSVS
jgi:acyl dehydratase